MLACAEANFELKILKQYMCEKLFLRETILFFLSGAQMGYTASFKEQSAEIKYLMCLHIQ